MKLSTDRILTTHVGSLPRPEALLTIIRARHEGQAYDKQALAGTLRQAVADIVKQQVDCGIDVVSDGELSKISYATYVQERMTGFGGAWAGPAASDMKEFREFAIMAIKTGRLTPIGNQPCCQGPVALKNTDELEADLANFQAAVAATPPVEGFMNAASPGVVAVFLDNQHYPSHEAYLDALAQALRVEYEAITKAGFILQIDAPDLAMGRHIRYASESLEEFRKRAALHIEVLNHATANIPPEQMRLHLCWGNYTGPHHHDVPLEDILDIVLQARPQALSFEGANPRHEHEWDVWATARIPEDKVLLPGVVDSTSNFIEHPRLVAQRIRHYADIVGRERVLASSDCGFSTFAGYPQVHQDITWAKFKTMAEGARIASGQLW